ncbi:MAG: hypothetical protein J6P58_05385, partial [Oscillospiraceae bacterium]|nr:hypothetical protein [Oscillospiraceae bacterium]
MSIREILLWLEQCPVLQGEKINWSFLPGYRGWSLTVPKAETKTDIIGNSHSVRQLKITRRISIQSNA